MRTLTKTFLAFCLISFAATPTYAFSFMRWRCCRPVVVSSCCCRPVVVPCCCCSEWPAAEPSQPDARDVPAAPVEENAGESEAPEAAVEEAPPEA